MEKFPTNEPTPEQKAEFQQSRTLSDAELIKNGAQFVPDSNGEPVLEVPSKLQKSLEILRQAPETQKLLKLLKKTAPERGSSAMMGSSLRFPIESLKSLFYPGISLYKYREELSPEEKERYSFGMGMEYETSVELEDDKNGLPYLSINRTKYVINGGETKKGPSTKCYSLKEFYENLTPEEKEKGEELGKTLESLLSEDK